MTRALAISDTGLRLIKAFEGFRPDDRTLVTGTRVVGYGHRLDMAAASVHMSRADAEEQLLSDLEPIEDIVNEEVHAPLSQGQFDALCSLAFNIGPEAFRGSDLVRAMNNGRVLDAANGFDVWRKATVNGQDYVVDALMRRRTAEKSLFLRNEPAVPAPSAMLIPLADDNAPLGPTDDGLRKVTTGDASGVIEGANIINADRVDPVLVIEGVDLEATDTPTSAETYVPSETDIETSQNGDADPLIDEEPNVEDQNEPWLTPTDAILAAAPASVLTLSTLVDPITAADAQRLDADEDLFDGIDEDDLVEVALDDAEALSDDFDDLSESEDDDDFEDDEDDDFDVEDDDDVADDDDDFEDEDDFEADDNASYDDETLDDDTVLGELTALTDDDDIDDDGDTTTKNTNDPSIISTASFSLGDRLSALLDSNESDTEIDALDALPTSLLKPTNPAGLTDVDQGDDRSRSNLVSFPKRELVLDDAIVSEPAILDATSTETNTDGLMVIDDLAADDVLRASREPENPVFDPEGDPVENAMRYLERQALEKKAKKSGGGLWIPIVIGIVLVSLSAAFISRGGMGMLSAWGPTATVVAAITGGMMLLFALYTLIRKWSGSNADVT